MLQIQNERLQERRLRTVPERVRVFRVPGRRVRHKVRDEPQRVAVSAQIGEGIVMAAHIHKIQHRERDSLLSNSPPTARKISPLQSVIIYEQQAFITLGRQKYRVLPAPEPPTMS